MECTEYWGFTPADTMGRRRRRKDENLFADLFSVIAPLIVILLFITPGGTQKASELIPVLLKHGTILGVTIFTTCLLSLGKRLRLINGKTLLRLIESLPDGKKQGLFEKITAGDHTTPTCPSCGTKMVMRTAHQGDHRGNKFWGCSNYPRCKNTLQATVN